MHPTSRPTTTAQDFMIGDPNRSQRMMVTKTRKPSPMNSGLPHGSACGASGVGHRARADGFMPQLPEPPAQSFMPLSMRLAPISRTVGPVTSGGKMRFRMRGLRKERPISSREQRHDVPNRAPYPCGQARRFPSASVGQYPLVYIWLNVPVATVMVANEVPTTEMRPVPT